MRYKSVIENLAKEDLREAVKWYDSQQIGLGKKFLATVKKTIDQHKSYRILPKLDIMKYTLL
jgi:hypothetical protein